MRTRVWLILLISRTRLFIYTFSVFKWIWLALACFNWLEHILLKNWTTFVMTWEAFTTFGQCKILLRNKKGVKNIKQEKCKEIQRMQKSNKCIKRDGKQGVQSFGAFGQKDPKESFGLPFSSFGWFQRKQKVRKEAKVNSCFPDAGSSMLEKRWKSLITRRNCYACSLNQFKWRW